METFTDDTVVALASFLSPHDMLSLALSCKRFGDKHGTDTKRSVAREENIREVRQRTESISLMEVAARTVLFALATENERNALPRRGEESWIGIYHEFIVVFRLPLQFDKLAGDSIHYDDDSTNRINIDSIDKAKVGSSGPRPSSAICSNIMRAGKHRVSFQINGDSPRFGIFCGIMRPTTKDITSLRRCDPIGGDLSNFSLKDYDMLHYNNIDCCLMNTYLGKGIIRKRWKKWKKSELMAMDDEQRMQAVRQNRCCPFEWEGMEESHEASFKVGLILDLDVGTLDVFKNDRRLGTMKTQLTGEYCWAVFLVSLDGLVDSTLHFSISR